MTGGVAFEAVHHAGGLGTQIVVVLDDNGMSISPNVGALSRYFNRVRLNPNLRHAREEIDGGLTKLPAGLGPAFERLGPHVKESIKAVWAPGLWWEELGFVYMGVINGHDMPSLRPALREALAAERPVVVHCATVKGKGFAPAEEGGLEGMEKWHAAKPNSIFGGVPAQGAPKPVGVKPAPLQYTQVFGAALVAEARRDDRVLGITAAMSSGTGLNILQRELPDRYFDVGIAEQQAVLLAAGLALQGAKPVVAIYSTFLQRAYDQIVHDVCLQKLNVVFAMDRAGLVGDDGPTHHGAFDIGTGEILREGERVALLGYGSGVAKALAGLLADHVRDGRRRSLRQADRHRAGRPARRRTRPAGHGRGRRAPGRLRLGGVGAALRCRSGSAYPSRRLA